MVETDRRETLAPLIRVAWWLSFIFCVFVLIGSLPGYWSELNAVELGAGPVQMQLAAYWIGALSSIGCALLCLALAALLFFRKQTDPMALYLSFYLLMFGVFIVGPSEYFVPYWLPTMGDTALQWQTIVFPTPTLIQLLIFPSGHFVPRWTKGLAVGAFLITVTLLLALDDYQPLVKMNSPIAQFGILAIGCLILAAIAIQIFRYFRIYNPRERQQTKWVVFGFILSYALLGVVSYPFAILQNLPPGSPVPWWVPFMSMGWFIALSIQPLAFTIAIMRERLWDIDIILRRTVTYAIVTGLLVIVFFGTVVVLQRVFAGFTGTERNDLVTVISTLAIAALFVPLRNRVQVIIDRRFNRNKYDAQQILEHFALLVQDETNLERLTGELVNVVQETMQPKSVGLWLKDAQRRQGDR